MHFMRCPRPCCIHLCQHRSWICHGSRRRHLHLRQRVGHRGNGRSNRSHHGRLARRREDGCGSSTSRSHHGGASHHRGRYLQWPRDRLRNWHSLCRLEWWQCGNCGHLRLGGAHCRGTDWKRGLSSNRRRDHPRRASRDLIGDSVTTWVAVRDTGRRCHSVWRAGHQPVWPSGAHRLGGTGNTSNRGWSSGSSGNTGDRLSQHCQELSCTIVFSTC